VIVMEAPVSFFKLFLGAFAHNPRNVAGKRSLKIMKAGQAQPFWRERSGSRFISGLHNVRYAAKRAGQVTVELMLVLPVFMLILFFIMEVGNLAYQTILVHHCAYELARIGSLVAGPNGGNPSSGGNQLPKMKDTLKEMFPNSANIQLSASTENTLPDPQSHQNAQDLVVTLVYPAKLVFPGSSFFLSDRPRAQRIKRITVTVLMPIERPFRQ